MRKTITYSALIVLAAASLINAQTIRHNPEQVFNPARLQERQAAQMSTLMAFSQSDVYGVNGALVNWGGGGSFQYQWPLKPDLTGTLDIALIYLNLDNPFLPFYRNTYRRSDVMLVPLFLGLRRNVWADKVEGILPYTQIGAGPVAGINFPYGYGFWGSISHATTTWTLGGFFGFGANFGLSKKFVGGIDVRYNIMPFPEDVGPRHDYSGPSFSFSVMRGF
jgi:hypothetical protein